MGRRQGVLIETLARRGLAAGFVAVERGHPRETVSGARRRGDRGIGGLPGIAVRLACVMRMVMAVMPVGSGRGFGDAPSDQKSCGDDSQRRARPGCISQCQILTIQHIAVPRDSIATYVASGTPVPFGVVAVCWANEA